MKVIIGILIPFFGTSLGAAFVFFMRKSLSDMLQRALAGFAAGVMVAASIWSLLIPAIDQSSEMGKWSFVPATVGFWAGMMFLLMLDTVIPHLHQKSEKAEGPKSQLKRTTMMILAVTLHNIPEGMAVGVVYAGYLSGNAKITAAGAFALALGIAIQNLPEGAIISMPLRAEGMKKSKSIFRWRIVRNRRTDRGSAYDPCSKPDRSGTSVSVEFCSRSDALCGSRGIDPGDVTGDTLEYRNRVLCTWVQCHDGFRCCIRIKK